VRTPWRPRRSAEATPEEDLIERDLGRAAREAVAALPPADAEAILAVLAEGPGGRPKGAAFRKRLQRARQRLREAWSERHGAG
jgi:hypothetical protein